MSNFLAAILYSYFTTQKHFEDDIMPEILSYAKFAFKLIAVLVALMMFVARVALASYYGGYLLTNSMNII